MAARLSAIRARVNASLRRCGDPERAVTLVAVTKGHPASAIDALAELGVADIGENRVVEAMEKATRVRAKMRWHLIGHLQRNKVARAVRLFDAIHSVDSRRLLDALAAPPRPLQIFLEVNVAGETAKQGCPPEALPELIRAARPLPGLEVLGLMTMAPYSDDPETSRPVFRALRRLRDEWNARGELPFLRGLSMGMSGDFEVALEEGATHVRIGTAILGEMPEARG